MKFQRCLQQTLISLISGAWLLASGGVAAHQTANNGGAVQQPAAPLISFTRVPPTGGGPDRMETIAGVVSGANIKECGCKIVLFALTNLWYVQPYVAASFTEIKEDGRFETSIHLGSKYAALLVKPSYKPPSTTANLPPISEEVLAVATVDAMAEKPGEAHQDNQSSYTRVIQFSGYEWKVKTSATQIGPGPNYFSDRPENVSVDAAGRLHLRITHKVGQWQCAEVILTRSLGYGTYRFYLATAPEAIAKSVYAVLGMFTWSEVSAEFHHREIDCEISAWGEPNQQTSQANQLGQFVVQPWSVPHNIARYHLPPQLPATTHAFTWRPESVFCQSLEGHAARAASRRQVLYEHTFTRDIPPAADGTYARINLWLMAGRPPHGQELEVIISKFEYMPLP